MMEENRKFQEEDAAKEAYNTQHAASIEVNFEICWLNINIFFNRIILQGCIKIFINRIFSWEAIVLISLL